MTGADMVGQGRARVAVVLADKAALDTQAEMDEARVADDDALQPQQLVKIDRAAAGFADHPTPALNAILRRVFVFNRETGLRVLEQQKGGGARQEIGGHFSDGGAGAFLQVSRGQRAQGVRPGDHRAEERRAGQVVLDAMARRGRGRRSPLQAGIDDESVGALVGVRQVEPGPEQPFIEEPGPPGVAAGRRGADDRFQRSPDPRPGRGPSGRRDRALRT